MVIARSVVPKAGAGKPCQVSFTRLHQKSSSMKEDVVDGLRRFPKAISPKYFYDNRGSFLFDLICQLPEYYPTRTEFSILKTYAKDMMGMLGRDVCLIELGAGACQKSKFFLGTGAVSSFVPIDISDEFLRQSVLTLSNSFPHLTFHAVAMDFLDGIGRIVSLVPICSARLIFFAGSSIGNFDPPDTFKLLSQFHQLLGENGAVLIGYDLEKDPEILHKAYNDSRGVTAAFNLNLLTRLNREVRANFDLTAFRHTAFYNPVQGRIEMHLESLAPQEVSIGNSRFQFETGETIHTENSYKYSINRFDDIMKSAGFDRLGTWTDPDGLFALGLYAPLKR